MNYILGGGGFSSRLMESVREEQGLAYSIWSSFRPLKEAGEFRVTVQTKNQSAGTVVEEILRQMTLIAKERVTDRELEDAKSYLIGSFPRRLETMGKIAQFLTLTEYYGLGLDYPEKYRGYIESITREDIKRGPRRGGQAIRDGIPGKGVRSHEGVGSNHCPDCLGVRTGARTGRHVLRHFA
jgi:zinc protease